jgi:hypothetical protein
MNKVAFLCLTMMAIQMSVSCATDSTVKSWHEEEPADVLARGLASPADPALANLASVLEGEVGAEGVQYLANLDWGAEGAGDYVTDAAWVSATEIVRRELDANPTLLAMLTELLGPSRAHAQTCTAGATFASTVVDVFTRGAIAVTTISCAVVAVSAGTSAPVCVVAGLVAWVIVSKDVGCAGDTWTGGGPDAGVEGDAGYEEY